MDIIMGIHWTQSRHGNRPQIQRCRTQWTKSSKGIKGGMLFPLLTTGGINSILFGVYGNHLRQLQRTCHSDLQRKQLEDNHIFAAGTLAGFVQSFIACPFEIVKIRLQTHH
uniref:Uncharacterized protein n=1 Tax=Megaselia scalaris TaxID=36166 RepID=T1H4W5_MEGSC